MATGNFFGGQFFGGGFFGALTPDAPTGPQPSGGIPASFRAPQRTKDDIRRGREALGIQPTEAELAAQVVAEVAAQQAKRLELDEQKRFEELNRELELRGLQFEAQHLEAMNAQREALIIAEIAERIRMRMGEEELMFLMLVAAA